MSPYRLPVWKHDTFSYTLPYLVDCKQHKEFLLANKDQLIPNFLCSSIGLILHHGMQLDEHWPDICALAKNELKTYDRYVVSSVYKLGRFMALLGERNPEFWEIYEKKLVDEGLYRYLSEREAARLMRGMSEIGVGSDQLWELLESVIRKHHAFLSRKDFGELLDAFEISGKGSNETLRALKKHSNYQLS